MNPTTIPARILVSINDFSVRKQYTNSQKRKSHAFAQLCARISKLRQGDSGLPKSMAPMRPGRARNELMMGIGKLPDGTCFGYKTDKVLSYVHADSRWLASSAAAARIAPEHGRVFLSQRS